MLRAPVRLTAVVGARAAAATTRACPRCSQPRSDVTPPAPTVVRFASSSAPPASGSVDPEEVARFSSQASEWWKEGGFFDGLRAFNSVRVPHIVAACAPAPGAAPSPGLPLAGVHLLDVGCGGGLLAEPLARLGATVTGLDATGSAVDAARAHAALDPASFGGRLTYLHSTAEALLEVGGRYDAVVASEVVEHVSDRPAFLATLAGLLRPRGVLVVTTLNRSLPAFFGGILAAEYALRLVPPGTHEWTKFVTPRELGEELAACGLRVSPPTGFWYNPVTGGWSTSTDTSINYAIVATKPAE